MAEKHYVVQGATCQCKLSKDTSATDILQVKTQSKHFANDKDGANKLIATDKEIGQTFKKNTFGQCKNQPSGTDFLPCMVQITKWSEPYDKVTLSNQGKPLLESSKASCAMGTPDSIIIKDHGQVAEVSKKNVENTDNEVNAQIFPGIDLSTVTKNKDILNIPNN